MKKLLTLVLSLGISTFAYADVQTNSNLNTQNPNNNGGTIPNPPPAGGVTSPAEGMPPQPGINDLQNGNNGAIPSMQDATSGSMGTGDSENSAAIPPVPNSNPANTTPGTGAGGAGTSGAGTGGAGQ